MACCNFVESGMHLVDKTTLKKTHLSWEGLLNYLNIRVIQVMNLYQHQLLFDIKLPDDMGVTDRINQYGYSVSNLEGPRTNPFGQSHR